MKPLKRGKETDLIDIPASWYLDDLPPMMFMKAAPNSHGFVSPRHLGEMWKDQFDWVYREYDYAVFTLTIHPDVSGKAAEPLDAGAAPRPHEEASRREVRDLRGDRRRFRQALSAQQAGAAGVVTTQRRHPGLDPRTQSKMRSDLGPSSLASLDRG